MLRPMLLLFLLAAGCSKGPKADLPYIGEARSLASEWALVNEQAGEGHLTASYVRTMRASVREQLHTAATSLTDPKAAYAAEIAALMKEPDSAPAATLRAHADKLKHIEDSLESA
jgi:hypothetical protein